MGKLAVNDKEDLLKTLEKRFLSNMNRHKDLKWDSIIEKLNTSTKLWSLNEMEKTGGEPDVVKYDEITKEYIFYDCSKETPIARRSLCYDDEALESRKDYKPQTSALKMALDMGIELLNEEEYIYLQSIGEFDLKTSSWLKTPNEIRCLGGAIFGDRRYNRVFIYHNGAESYYAARGFRGSLRI